MMKKNLLKMRVCLGFDCKPRLDIISYEDELAPDGRAYQTTKGVRNEKTLVEFGQPWMRYDGSSNSPYWDAYVILDGSSERKAVEEKAVELHRMAIAEMGKSLDEEMKKFKETACMTADEAGKMIEEKLNPTANGNKVVLVEDFKRQIGETVLASGRQLASDNGFAVKDWEEFYAKTLTPEILTVLMKGLPVLRFVGNHIEFQTQEMYEQAAVAVAGKVTSDVFARFVETMGEKKE